MTLTSTLYGPLLLAVLAMVLPGRGLARWLALLGSVGSFLVGGAALLDFMRNPGSDIRWLEALPGFAPAGVPMRVGVDSLGASMLALSGLVTAVATIIAFHEERRPRLYHALVLLLLMAMNAVFVAQDLLLFYVAWEVLLAPMLLLVGLWGGAQRKYAATKFFVYTLAGSVAMLALLLLLWNGTPNEGRKVTLSPTTVAVLSHDGGKTVHDLPIVRDAAAGANAPATVVVPRDLDLRHLSLQWQSWRGMTFLGWPLAVFGFLAVLLACLVKVPSVPLHTWLPHAHVQAPTAVSVLLAGVLLKLGVFGIFRIAIPLFPATAVAAAPWIGGLGAVGILWGALVALGQRDLKRLVAYASVSHMGFCLLGIGASNTSGYLAGMVQAVAHGLSSPLLFILVGVIYERAHHRNIDGFGGLARPMPAYAWVLLFGALAGAGLPGLAGFPGEFLGYAAAFTAPAPFPLFATLALPAVILSAAYMLGALRKVAYGPLRHEEHASFPDLDRREVFAVLPLIVGIVVLGIWPGPLVDALRPPLAALAELLRSVTP